MSVRWRGMAEAQFLVAYDGPALGDGRMPVRDLAPALLALGEVFTEASHTAHPDQEPVALDIRATGEGSFDVSLIVHGPDLWDQLVHFFTSEDVTAIEHLKELVIGSGVGLFYLIKRLRGRRIKREEQLESGHVRMTLDDETTVDVPSDVATLYRKVTVRKKAREVVRPVGRRGVDRLDFRSSEGEVTVSIQTEDVSAFEVKEESEPLLESESQKLLSILSVVFTEGNKWRFTDGEATFSAAIEDVTFLGRVKHGEAFRDGDMLRCRIREVQSKRDEKLHSERHITEVIEHIPREPQLPLDPGEDA